MKKERHFISKAYEWCALKCRALLGAFGFLLPDIRDHRLAGCCRGYIRVIFFVATFALLAPVLVRLIQPSEHYVFACPVIFRPSCYNGKQPLTSTNFTYTGSYTWVQDSAADYRLKFLTSGVFTPQISIDIDVFVVGGGGGGGTYSSASRAGGGGGGGYTGTYLSVKLNANQSYLVTIGAGGNPGANGGTTSAFDHSVFGGNTGGNSSTTAPGGNGGSGGGTGANTNEGGGTNKTGGSNGSNGAGSAGGAGQGTTTREFGAVDGALYSGAGGGGCWDFISGSGGIGGGGKGAEDFAATAGAANTGGGGGGRAGGAAAAGGSGICIIRNSR